MKKGINLGAEKRVGRKEHDLVESNCPKLIDATKSDELRAIEEMEDQEEEMREEEIEQPQEKLNPIGDGVDRYEGYHQVQFPTKETLKMSLSECWIPPTNIGADGREYKDYLYLKDGVYELHMYSKCWQWAESRYVKVNKVIFRKTVAYILRSVARSEELLFIPKTNQLFELF